MIDLDAGAHVDMPAGDIRRLHLLGRVMLKKQIGWRANRSVRALKRLAEIEASIVRLEDEDLLDFADIFVGEGEAPLGALASAEMARRGIKL